MAMVTAMVMAMGDERTHRRSRRLLRTLRTISGRHLAAFSAAPPALRACVAGMGCLALSVPAHADNWRLSASTSITEQYTSNVNYTANQPAVSDFATSVAGTVAINGQGAHAKLNGTIGATGIFYAKETQNNSFAPSVNLAGNVEAIEKFFYVDAAANVYQTFLSPFGAQPPSLVNATANRYTSQTYSLSPYIQGHVPGTYVTYKVRDDNTWTAASNYGNSSIDAPSTYFNQFDATIDSPPAPYGWSAEYNRGHYAPSTRDDTFGQYTIQVARLLAIYEYDPTLQVSLRGGYEKDEFPLTGSDGIIYGAGLKWAPSDRTQASGYWEHRFFGASYSAQITHRLPRTALSLTFARGITTYPQNAVSIPAGANVAAFLDAAFQTRIPDAAERALAVQQVIAQSSLPTTLATPVNIFAANVLLQTSANASAVLIGLRNSLAFNVFYLKSASISGTGQTLPDALQGTQNNTQVGAGVSFSHKLSGFSSFAASANYSRTTSNDLSGPLEAARSANFYASAGFNTQLGPKTTASLYTNYSRFQPFEVGNQTSANAFTVSAGLSHIF
jgi:uncharacterized protein (PEP-CTERM system associated)